MNWVSGIFDFVSRAIDDDRTCLGKNIYCGRFTRFMGVFVLFAWTNVITMALQLCIVAFFFVGKLLYRGIFFGFWVFLLHTLSNSYIGHFCYMLWAFLLYTVSKSNSAHFYFTH